MIFSYQIHDHVYRKVLAEEKVTWCCEVSFSDKMRNYGVNHSSGLSLAQLDKFEDKITSLNPS